MLRRTLFYIIIGLSLTTISCKDSKKSNSDKKAKVEQPAPQPLPEIPHSDNPVDGQPNDGNQNPGFSEGETEYVHVSRKFCLKVIHGKYIQVFFVMTLTLTKSIKPTDGAKQKQHTDILVTDMEPTLLVRCSSTTQTITLLIIINVKVDTLTLSNTITVSKKIYFASLLNYTSFLSYHK